MASNPKQWTFTEKQRHSVCLGEICPRCLCDDIKTTSTNDDGINANVGYRCQQCGEDWEGY